MSRLPICTVLLALAASSHAEAALLAYFNFNNSSNYNSSNSNLGSFRTSGTAEVYNAASKAISKASAGVHAAAAELRLSALSGSNGGSETNNWGSHAGVPINTLAGHIDGNGLAITGSGNNSKWITFKLTTSGYGGPVVTYGVRGTGAGYDTHEWRWSLSETSGYTTFQTLTGTDKSDVIQYSVDTSGVSQIRDKDTIYLRLMLSGATSTTAVTRFDNFQFNADIIPEPAAGAMVAGLTAVVCGRRRRYQHTADGCAWQAAHR